MEESNPANEPVAFDMGISTLTRINYWLWRCNDAADKNDIDGWFRAIKTIFKETDAFMDETERKNHTEKLKVVETNYKEYIGYINGFKVTIAKNPNAQFQPPRKIFDTLFDWELELRRILDKKNILMRKGEDSRKAML